MSYSDLLDLSKTEIDIKDCLDLVKTNNIVKGSKYDFYHWQFKAVEKSNVNTPMNQSVLQNDSLRVSKSYL